MSTMKSSVSNILKNSSIKLLEESSSTDDIHQIDMWYYAQKNSIIEEWDKKSSEILKERNITLADKGKKFKACRHEFTDKIDRLDKEYQEKLNKVKEKYTKESEGGNMDYTNIKLSIYESYDNGEITEAEKYDLLNSLENSVYESTAAQRNEIKLRDEFDKIEAESAKKIDALRKKIKVLRNLHDNADSDAEKNKISEKIDKIRSEIKRIDNDKEDKEDRLYDTLEKNYIGDCETSPSSSLNVGRHLARNYKNATDDDRDYAIDWGRRYKNTVRDSKFYSKGKDPNDKKPNKYLNAQKALKESVDDIKLSIYESYDNGEITEAEKDYLLNFIDD